MWQRFWFRSRKAVGGYAPEVLNAGWVPLWTSEGKSATEAGGQRAHSLVFMAPASSSTLQRQVSGGSDPGSVAAIAEADIGEMLIRFYANQAC
jgi:hypothetical protein